MRGVRGGAVGALTLMGLLLGGGCGGQEWPSARQREARSDLLNDLLAAQQSLPAPEALEAQRQVLREGGGPGVGGGGGAGEEVPTLGLSGTVEGRWAGALRVRDAQGVSQEVRVDDTTRYVAQGEVVSRGAVREGARVRVFYDVQRDDGVAREVEVVGAPE